MYGGDLNHMTPKAFWEHPSRKFPPPNTPLVPTGDDDILYVAPCGGPMV